MRTGYLECFSGISGDMLLGALVDAGVSYDLLAEAAVALGVGARLEQRLVTRGGIAGTKIDVIIEGETDHHEHHDHQHAHSHHHSHQEHRSLSKILEIISHAPIPDGAKERAKRAFMLLGEAEAKIHQKPVEEIHFHEIGAVDTIVDIVCTAVGAESLKIDRWYSSALNVGSGTVECAHGILPVPAPATLALLGTAPVYAAGPAMERVTPTGAAILRMLDVKFQGMPAMTIHSSGYGAGGKDLVGIPNLLRLVIGDEAAASAAIREPLAVLEAVIDDSNPQVLGYVCDQLLDNGANDVYQTATHMKKNRNGVLLTVLCHPDRLEALREIVFRETSTIGMHWRFDQKIALNREFCQVTTPWGPVQIKVALWPDGTVVNAQPEYEHCRMIAEREEIPLKQVMQAASAIWWKQNAGAAKREE